MRPSNIAEILGGSAVLEMELHSQLDLMALGIRGVSKQGLLNLASYLGLSVKEISDLLPLTERTVQRYARDNRFRAEVSEHILHIAEAAARGVEVFGDKQRFIAWLAQSNAALGNRTPKELLSSRIGVDLVLDELGRIEHGIVV